MEAPKGHPVHSGGSTRPLPQSDELVNLSIFPDSADKNDKLDEFYFNFQSPDAVSLVLDAAFSIKPEIIVLRVICTERIPRHNAYDISP